MRAALLLALLTLLVFAGSLKMGFVNWDDHVYVYENSLVLHPSWAGCWRLLTGFYEHFYIPLVFLSYCADSILWQGKTWGYHLTNVLLHGASGVLVFFIFRRLFGSALVAFVAAALHQVHPLRVESVTWVTERKDTLCFLFYAAGVLLYLRHLAGERRWAYGPSVLACVLAMLSKPAALTLPLLLLLLDWHTLGRIRLRDKWPYLAIVVVFTALNGIAQSRVEVIRALHGGGVSSHVATVCRVFLFYLAKAAFPVHLSANYLFLDVGRLGAKGLVSVLCVMGLGAACVYGLWRRQTVAFGFAAFCLLLGPVSNVIPITIVAADRYTYLPSLGLSVMAAAGLRAMRGPRAWRNACLVAGLSALAALTVHRIPVWRNGETLWADALRKGCFSPRVWNGYASASLYAGRVGRAEAMAHRSVKRDPEWAATYRLLGEVFKTQNRMPEAAACFRRAVQSPKASADECLSLAFVLMVLGEREEALRAVNLAQTKDPQHPRAYLALGDLYYGWGRLAESEEAYRRAVAMTPRDAEPHLGLARALEARRALGEAEEQCRVALQRNPESVTGLNQLAALLARQRRDEESESLLRRALGLNPAEPGTYVNLGNVLAQRNRLQEAEGMYRTALRLDPNRQNARQNLANLLRLMGRPADSDAQPSGGAGKTVGGTD